MDASLKTIRYWDPIVNNEQLRERKKEWRLVKISLNQMTDQIPRSMHKYHKKLFFHGTTVVGGFGDTCYESKPYGFSLSLFLLWYHPGDPEQVWQDIYNNITDPNDLDRARYYFLMFSDNSEFATEYGMMGGREEQAMKMLFPGLDYKEEREFKGYRETFPLSLSLANLRQYFISGTASYLSGNYPRNPFSPVQYSWDHIDYGVRHYLKESSDKEAKHVMQSISRVFWEILDFDRCNQECLHYERAFSLREQLYNRLENRRFCQILIDIWEESKKAYANGEMLVYQ